MQEGSATVAHCDDVAAHATVATDCNCCLSPHWGPCVSSSWHVKIEVIQPAEYIQGDKTLRPFTADLGCVPAWEPLTPRLHQA